MSSNAPAPGLIALHSHQSEVLAETLTGWLRAHPLQPLESEVVLVQCNGMAEWIKIALAQHSGVCAAAQVELPSRFIWRTCRQVLGPDQVPRESPLDKLPLTWRLMDLLPRCVDEAVFAPVRGFLQGDEPDRLLQLASRLADLFDQYQIYRPDWLQDWAAGDDVCRQPSGEHELAPDQRWQPELWRRVLATLHDTERAATRPALHQRVLAHLRAGHAPVQPVARRVSVFGMSHMPLQLLELLAALAQHSQVLLAVPNPCRYHWGEIMDGREWLRSERQRQKDKGQALADTPLEQMHLHAPTLLAAWGRQGRDFIRMLDAFDDAQAACERAQLPTLDFFDDAPITDGTPMLTQLQRRIRDLLPSTVDAPAACLPAQDGSVLFRLAHSPVRELEVLHDQLLDWLAQPPGGVALSPREVVVMVPDIERMAPAIEAVFGQYPRGDARHIPFAIADLGAQASSPLIHAVQWLLALPQPNVHALVSQVSTQPLLLLIGFVLFRGFDIDYMDSRRADRFIAELARFEREARAVASLNHPHICTLFDIGPDYMVMELIEGETLAQRIAKGPIPLDQAIQHATQIADALDREDPVGALATFARVNEFGFIESPYRKVVNGKVTKDIVYLPADEEEEYVVAQANAPLNADGTLNANTSAAMQVKSAGANGGPFAPRDACQEDVYIAAGGETETFRPRFTWHGFRYVEITGLPAATPGGLLGALMR